jgi:glycosyltransferase involved in cell wall biosynthesis
VNIVLTADPEIPVPPKHYGGIERIVDMLAKGLLARGHQVTLFAHPESVSSGRLVPWTGPASGSRRDTIRNAASLARHVAAQRYDVLHSFSRLAYLLPVLPLTLPKIMSYQRAISPRTTRLADRLAMGSLEFTAVSRWMIEPVKHIGRWHVIPNGVPADVFTYRPTVPPESPLVFLGRIEEIKGPHLAIEVARNTGNRLVIAGNVPPEKEAWARENVFAHVDGDRVRYIGPVDDQQKNALLGTARAFLMPISWDEPFGIVMAEALACGTPVIGLRRGAVPEVVEHRVTGFVCDGLAGMIDAVGRIDQISRAACRRDCEQRYGSNAIVDAYVSLYETLVAGHSFARTAVAP